MTPEASTTGVTLDSYLPNSVTSTDIQAEREQARKKNDTFSGARFNSRQRPLARFTQGEQSPSFYLSLSDLMSLLLVFFVLIFSLSEYKISNQPEKESQEPKAKIFDQISLVHPEKQKGIDPFADPPLFASLASETQNEITRNQNNTKAAVKPIRLDDPPVPWVTHTSKGPLMDLLTQSATLPAAAVPKEEKNLTVLLAQVRKEVKKAAPNGVELESRPKSLIVRLPESITFDSGRAVIKPGMQEVLQHLGRILAEHKGYQIVVSGHTDNLPINNNQFASNWDLSAARAAIVARSLIKQGLDNRSLTIQGLADQKPIASNLTKQGRSQNRRVEIELRSPEIKNAAQTSKLGGDLG
jgi:chemotaxis protein MotB